MDFLIDIGEISSKQFSFELLAPKNVKHSLNLKHIPLKCVGLFSGHLWEQLELPFYAKGALLINLCNTAPLLTRLQIVTIHDAVVYAFPDAYSFIFRSWYQLLWPSLGVVAKQILTTSLFSKKELMQHCKISQEKLQIVYAGKEHILAIQSDEKVFLKHGLVGRKYALAVSSLNPNKNFSSIVRAIEILGDVDFDIVIVGGANPKIFSQTQISLPNSVKYLGYVSDAELKALYEYASCFIYPSFYEGFGLPPLEAMACGCPVIVSGAASLPEACADAALYCDPYDLEDIANKLVMLMNNTKLREELRQKGLERAKQFTWQKCAREAFAVIEKVLASQAFYF